MKFPQQITARKQAIRFASLLARDVITDTLLDARRIARCEACRRGIRYKTAAFADHLRSVRESWTDDTNQAEALGISPRWHKAFNRQCARTIRHGLTFWIEGYERPLF